MGTCFYIAVVYFHVFLQSGSSNNLLSSTYSSCRTFSYSIMVELSAIQASNSNLANNLPTGMVAVFVGATSGIGEYSLKAFAHQTKSPKLYFVGRSQDAANRIISECKELNNSGQYIFLKSDVSLLKNVDEVCQQILAQEDSINLLFQTQGTMLMESELPLIGVSFISLSA